MKKLTLDRFTVSVWVLFLLAPFAVAMLSVAPPTPPKVGFASTPYLSLLPVQIVDGVVYTTTDLVLWMSNVTSGSSQAKFFGPDLGFHMLKTPTSIFVEQATGIVTLIGQELISCFRLYNGALTPWRVIEPNFLMLFDIAVNPGKTNPKPGNNDYLWFIGSANSQSAGGGTTSQIYVFEPTDGDVMVALTVPYVYTNFPTAMIADAYLFVCQGRTSATSTAVDTHFIAAHYLQARLVDDIVSLEPTPLPLFSNSPSSSSAPGIFLTIGFMHYFAAQYHRLVVYNLSTITTPVIAVYNYSLAPLFDIPLGNGCYLPVADPIVGSNQTGNWLFVFCNASVITLDINANFSQVSVVEIPTNSGDPDYFGPMNSAASPSPRIMYAELREDVGACGGVIFVATNQGHLAFIDFCDIGTTIVMSFHNESAAAPRAYEARDFSFQGVTIAKDVVSNMYTTTATGTILVFTGSYGVSGFLRGFLIRNGTVPGARVDVTEIWAVADGVNPLGPAAIDPTTGYVAVTTASGDMYNFGILDLFRMYDTSQFLLDSNVSGNSPFGPMFSMTFTAPDGQLLPAVYTGDVATVVLEDNRSSAASSDATRISLRTIVISNSSWTVLDSTSSSLIDNVQQRTVNFSSIGISELSALVQVPSADASSVILCGIFGSANIAQCINSSSLDSSATSLSFSLCGFGVDGAGTTASGDLWVTCSNATGSYTDGAASEANIATVLNFVNVPATARNISVNASSTTYPDHLSSLTPTYDPIRDVFFSLAVRPGMEATEVGTLYKFAPNGTRYWQRSVNYAPSLPAVVAGSVRFMSGILVEEQSGVLTVVIRATSLVPSENQTHLYCVNGSDGSFINATLLWPLRQSLPQTFLTNAATADEFSAADNSGFALVSGTGVTHWNGAGDYYVVLIAVSRTYVLAASATTGEVLYARQVANASDSLSYLLPSSLAASVEYGVAAVMSRSGVQAINIFTGFTMWTGYLTAGSSPGETSPLTIRVLRGRVLYCDGSQVVGAAVATGRIVFAVAQSLADEGLVLVTAGQISRFFVTDGSLGSLVISVMTQYGVSLALVPKAHFVDVANPTKGPDRMFHDYIVLGRFQNWFALTATASASSEPTKTLTGNWSRTQTPTRTATPTKSGGTPSPTLSPSATLSPNATNTTSMLPTVTLLVSTSTTLRKTDSAIPTPTHTLTHEASKTVSHLLPKTMTDLVSQTVTMTATAGGTVSETEEITQTRTATLRQVPTDTMTHELTGELSASATHYNTATAVPPTTGVPPTAAPTTAAPSPTPLPTTAVPLPATPRPANVTTGAAPPSSSSSKAWIAGPVLGGVAVLAGIVVFLHDGGSGSRKEARSAEGAQGSTPRQARRKDRGVKDAATAEPAVPQQGRDLESSAVPFDDPFRDPFEDPFAERDREMLVLQEPPQNLQTNPLLELEKQQQSSSVPSASVAAPSRGKAQLLVVSDDDTSSNSDSDESR